jgi:hypothetical protein
MCRKELFVSENEEYESDSEDGGTHYDEQDSDPYEEGTEPDDQASLNVDPENQVIDPISDDEEDLPEDLDQGVVSLPEREPVFCIGRTRDAKYLNYECGGVPHWPDAAAITEKLWKRLYNICHLDQIHEDNIEFQVHLTIRHGDPTDQKYVVIWWSQWPKVLEVARDMVRHHCKNRKFVTLHEEAMDEWLKKLEEEIGWELCGKVGETCSYTGEEGPCTGWYRNGW